MLDSCDSALSRLNAIACAVMEYVRSRSSTSLALSHYFVALSLNAIKLCETV